MFTPLSRVISPQCGLAALLTETQISSSTAFYWDGADDALPPHTRGRSPKWCSCNVRRRPVVGQRERSFQVLQPRVSLVDHSPLRSKDLIVAQL